MDKIKLFLIKNAYWLGTAFAIAVLLLMTPFAHAQVNPSNVKTVDVSELTPEQRAQILSNVAQLQGAKAENISEAVRTEASKWGELGVNMGRAVVGAAKEVGVAANEFATTPLGKVTVGIIVYKIVGQELLAFGVGFGILVFALTMATYFAFRKKGKVEYEYSPILWGAMQRKRVKRYEPDTDSAVIDIIAAGVTAAAGLFIGINLMF